MIVVGDCNIVMAALIRDAYTRRLLTSQRIEAYSPAYVFEELAEHAQEISPKVRIARPRIQRLLSLLRRVIIEVPERTYRHRLGKAAEIVADADDAPYLAAASVLAENGDCAIWTSDKAFLRKGVEIRQAFGIPVLDSAALATLLEQQSA